MIEVVQRRRTGSNRMKNVGIATCDTCSTKFEITHSLKWRMSQDHHFCSRKCSASSHANGPSAKKRKQTCNERYGVDTPFLSIECREKARITCQKNYGVDSPAQSPAVLAKAAQTNLERYGTRVPSQSERVKQRARETSLAKYGVDWPVQSLDVRERIKSTLLARYGVTCMFLTENSRRKATSEDAFRKRHQTFLKNGTYSRNSSKEEDKAYSILCTLFGDENVERHVMVNDRWPIDFYIANIDTYVQYDGSYVHGLDRPRDVIESSGLKRDKAIIAQLERDSRQNEWFRNAGMKLVRLRGCAISAMNTTTFTSYFS